MPIVSNSIVREERAQTLVVVLLMLVIAVIVATAISYRTIQDINRAGEERLSAKASAQVESFLDLFTEEDNWNSVWDEGGDCDGIAVGDVCALSSMQVQSFLNIVPDDFECDSSSEQVLLRTLTDVEAFRVEKDDVFEVPLNDDSPSAGSFNLGWSGDADYLIVKVYTPNDVDGAYSLTRDNPDGWGNVEFVSEGASFSVPYSADATLARIRPVGGYADLNISGDLPPLVAHIKASCYIDDVYREYVREFQLYSSVPSVFDYVLFDGSSPDGISK